MNYVTQGVSTFDITYNNQTEVLYLVDNSIKYTQKYRSVSNTVLSGYFGYDGAAELKLRKELTRVINTKFTSTFKEILNAISPVHFKFNSAWYSSK